MIRHAPSIGIGIGLSLRSQGFGIRYTRAGRVLDYSTQVGPFTIVDKSGEGNTATLYSGRGLTMDGVGDLIDFGSPTFSEPVTRMTGLARSTDTSINLGLTSATLAGNDTWETFSADTPAKDYGDAQWFNGTNAYVGLGAGDPLGFNGSGRIDFGCNVVIGAIPTSTEDIFYQYVNATSVGFSVDIQSSGQVRVSGRSVSADSFQSLLSTALATVGETRIDAYIDYANDELGISLNGGAYKTSSVVFGQTSFTYGSSTNNTRIGNSQHVGRFFTGSVLNAEIQKDSVASNSYTGRGATPWTDTIGSNDGTVSGVDQTAAQHFTNPDFILGTGYNGDLSDVRCLGATGTVLGHWSLADWSNPSGNTSNGKTIVDSGPNDYHGTCTGCSGFTGEGIDPEVAGIVGYDDKMYFDGVDDYVRLDTTVSLAVGEYIEGTQYWQTGDRLYLSEDIPSAIDFLSIIETGTVLFRLNGVIYTHAVSANASAVNVVRLTRSAVGSYTLSINGNDEVFATASAAINLRDTGGSGALSIYFKGVPLVVNYNGTEVYTNTGTASQAGYTVNGTPVTVGQKRATIPQTADKNWNKYSWFNGTDTKVTVGAPISDVGAIEVKFVFSDTEGVVFLSQQNGVALYGLSITQSRTAGNVHIAFHKGSSAFEFISQSGFSAGELITATAFYNFTTSTFSINVNGGTGDGTLVGRHAPAASLNLFQIGANGNDTFFTNGIISDLKEYDTDQVTAIRHYTGLGNDPWADTIGTNDGTEAGTFARELVTASDANNQIDALGTAISEPRLNTQQLNLFGEGEYSLTPDSASLDLTTTATWEIWGNFYGVPASTQQILTKQGDAGAGKRSWIIQKLNTGAADETRFLQFSSSDVATIVPIGGIPDSVGMLSFTLDQSSGVLAYFNGVPLTVSAHTPAIIGVSDAPVVIGSNAALLNVYDDKVGSTKIYNVALTADEVLTNYNTQKSLYGL